MTSGSELKDFLLMTALPEDSIELSARFWALYSHHRFRKASQVRILALLDAVDANPEHGVLHHFG